MAGLNLGDVQIFLNCGRPASRWLLPVTSSSATPTSCLNTSARMASRSGARTRATGVVRDCATIASATLHGYELSIRASSLQRGPPLEIERVDVPVGSTAALGAASRISRRTTDDRRQLPRGTLLHTLDGVGRIPRLTSSHRAVEDQARHRLRQPRSYRFVERRGCMAHRDSSPIALTTAGGIVTRRSSPGQVDR